MATILTKKSDTSSSVPLAADLTNAAGGAELAVNTADKRLYSKTSGGSVVELGTNPSALSLPNGTANGVPYLNGSKVLTSGGALTFDGATLINTSGAFQGYDNLTLTAFVNGTNGTVVNINSAGTGGITKFSINGSEQMRLTSTGLGIGTSSPEQRLHVSNTGSTGVSIKFTNSVASAGILSYSSDSFLFYTGNTVRATLDSSGNLGLGVTPSAWATAKAIQVGLYGSISSLNNSTYIGQNFYYNAGFLYQNATSRYACLYEQNQFNGVHAWYTAPSGTAGNAISFTQAMTLDASGNLLVGTTTAYSGNRITVNSSIAMEGPSIPQINYYSTASTIEYVNRAANGAKTYSWYYGAGGSGAPATLSTSGVWTNASDARGKENIANIHYGLDAVLALAPRQYDVKSDGRRAIGFVAQEVLPIIPELVHVTKGGAENEFYGLDYGSMTAVLVKAIQEQQALITALTARVAALESK